MKSIASAAVLLIFLARAGVGQQLTFAFSDASRPGKLRTDLVNGSLDIIGYDGKDVVIESADGSGKGIPSDAVTASEKDNVLTLHGGLRKSSKLRIRVPHKTELSLRCMNCGEVALNGISADIDIDVVNGDIRMTGVGGSVVAHSLNGKVSASLDGLGAKPSSFSSLNGSVEVTLPDDTKANVRLRTEHGKIHTEFELRLQGALRTDRGFVGTINGGGPEVQARTFNGSIYLRKKSLAK